MVIFRPCTYWEETDKIREMVGCFCVRAVLIQECKVWDWRRRAMPTFITFFCCFQKSSEGITDATD